MPIVPPSGRISARCPPVSPACWISADAMDRQRSALMLRPISSLNVIQFPDIGQRRGRRSARTGASGTPLRVPEAWKMSAIHQVGGGSIAARAIRREFRRAAPYQPGAGAGDQGAGHGRWLDTCRTLPSGGRCGQHLDDLSQPGRINRPVPTATRCARPAACGRCVGQAALEQLRTSAAQQRGGVTITAHSSASADRCAAGPFSCTSRPISSARRRVPSAPA